MEQGLDFWEDLWLGSSSLAIQYWELYCIVNKQGKIIVELWDGVDLRWTFKRCVGPRLMFMWDEVVNSWNPRIKCNTQFRGQNWMHYLYVCQDQVSHIKRQMVK
jgi:hypothetical protein